MTDEERQEREKFFTPEESITFNMLDKGTINKLIRDGDVILPHKDLDKIKDERWNTKQLTSKLLQGILNGDSIPKIANSFTDVIGNNEASTMRNARTMITSAQNAGRFDSYKNLESQGVIQKKIWMSTPDDRTRPTHVDIDGEEQDINDQFSNGCMYPGDGKGPAEEVWNCRCTMRDHIIGFRRADGSISKVNYDRGPTMHDEQMENLNKKDDFSVIKKRAEKALLWKGGKPYDDDLFEKNAENMGLKIHEDANLNRDYVILNDDIILYHNTSEDTYENYIKENGLLPQDRGGKQISGVYLTGGENDLSGWKQGVGNSVTLKILIPKGTKLYQDVQPNAVFVINKILASRIIKVIRR